MEIEKFTNDVLDVEVRVVMIDEEPWLVVKDLCDALGLSQVNKATLALDEDEKGWTTVPTPGGDQQVSVVNEAGLYSLILRSRKPEAKSFKRWVTHEVLPAIRRTGKYDRFEAANDTDLLRAAEPIMNALTKRVRELEPKAEVRDGIYEFHEGYTRNNIWKMARTGAGYSGSHLEFNRLLMDFGITRTCGNKFVLSPEYYWISNDAEYYSHNLGSHMPSKNPHFNEAGKDAILKMVADHIQVTKVNAAAAS